MGVPLETKAKKAARILPYLSRLCSEPSAFSQRRAASCQKRARGSPCSERSRAMRSAAIHPLLITPIRVQLATFGQERGVPLRIDQTFVLVERVLAKRQLSRFNELLHLLSANSQL